MNATVTNLTATELAEPMAPPHAERFGQRLLLVNAIVLGAVALMQALFDLAGHFLEIGPLAGALAGKSETIGFFEAHGLALIVSILMLTNARAEGATWNWVAAAVHALLGAANLMFWPVFVENGMVTMGVVATGGHGVFLVLQLVAAFARTPAILGGPGALFRALTLVTLWTGAVLHISSLPLGRERFVEVMLTPLFDAVFAIPMTLAGVVGWLLLPRAIFRARWERVVYVAMLLYLTLSIVIHLRTLVTWDTSYVLAFPSWYSLPILVLFGLLTAFTIRQRFRPAAGRAT
jgi:hypothetical protein